ncbi:MAG: transcriptional repressor LexA [Thermodesulfobacteriota bacterium]
MLTKNGKRKLTARQREVLSFLIRFIDERGYPPTVREIALYFGLKGPRSPKKRLDALEEKGYIRRNPGKSRAIEVVGVSPSWPSRLVPLVGKVRAGRPSLAFEDLEGTLLLGQSLARGGETLFLKVNGDSMIGDHIKDGDLALIYPQSMVENGEIAVVLIDDEATVKRVYKEGDALRLQPSNPIMKPTIVGMRGEKVTIVGKVIGIFRKVM